MSGKGYFSSSVRIGFTSECECDALETDEDSNLFRLRALPTDNVFYSPFAVHGGHSIEHIRLKIKRRKLHKPNLTRQVSREDGLELVREVRVKNY